MKILELKLLVNGYQKNRDAALESLLTRKQIPTPYPACTKLSPYISILKVQIDDRMIVKQIIHSLDHILIWESDSETLKHMIYFELMDEVFALERLDFNEQAKKILGDTIERI